VRDAVIILLLFYSSRLGCQVEITKEMEGMIVAVPEYGEPFVDLPFTQ